ncbi:MAG: AmmeMemoRadiSam system radical SAM enzyme, partial [Clostridiales bacterium]
TNGFINIRPLTELVKYIDAFNIDIKSFNDEFYKKFCGSNILSVLKTIEYLKDKCHIELTALIIPTLNDDENEFENLSKWIAELSVDIPLHITRYFPRYKMDIQSTPIDTLIKFEKIALKYLKNVFIGNI